jgi:hypothetical protein
MTYWLEKSEAERELISGLATGVVTIRSPDGRAAT